MRGVAGASRAVSGSGVGCASTVAPKVVFSLSDIVAVVEWSVVVWVCVGVCLCDDDDGFWEGEQVVVYTCPCMLQSKQRMQGQSRSKASGEDEFPSLCVSLCCKYMKSFNDRANSQA